MLPLLIELHVDAPRKHRAFPRLVSVILPNRITRRIFPSSPRLAPRTSSLPCFKLLLTVWAGRVTIDDLPEDILLRIFDFDRLIYLDGLAARDRLWRPSLYWGWHRLVHVCKSWRSVVFGSPKFLDLRLICGPRTPVKFTHIWPELPIILRGNYDGRLPESYDLDAAIVHPNRVCEINLRLSRSQLRQLISAMQDQFPALIHLTLSFFDNDTVVDKFNFNDTFAFFNNDSGPAPTLTSGFLGGSGNRLQSLELDSIPFPTLPKLLLSANDLVRLTLKNIPHSGYVSSEAIVTGLAVSTNLKYLTITFKSPISRPTRQSPRTPPPTRMVLPTLTRFEFKGASEYLEDFVARIDAPWLDSICITFFHQLIFHIPQLAQFMKRTAKFQELKEAHVDFGGDGAHVETLPPTRTFDDVKSGLGISCKELDWQLSSLAQVSHLSSHLSIWSNTSTSKSLGISRHSDKTTSRTCNGWNFSTRLPR
jgi:hypothetical protein